MRVVSIMAHADDERLRVDLRTPLRNAITLASPPRSIGWVFAPNFSVDYRPSGRAAGWNLGVLGGPLYAQRRYHEYFYSVAPQYALPARPALRFVYQYLLRGGFL